MAVQGHGSDEVVIKGFKTIYGIAPFKVVAVNPTLDELTSLGVNFTKEPEYVGEKSRIEFWLQTNLKEKKEEGSADKSLEELGIKEQIVQKVTFFISDKLKGKEDGTTEVWINNFGRVCSTPKGEKPSASWWKSDGEHVAREGEIELVKFLRAWVNAGTTDEVYIDDWGKLIAGNVKELKDILHTFKNNVVRSMIEVRVKDGKTYTNIYPNYHEPWNIVGTTGWMKEFKVQKKGHFISYQLKEFVPNDPTPTADPVVSAEAKTEWT